MNNELIGWYLNKSTGERVDFLYMNYPRLKRIMKGYQDSLYIFAKSLQAFRICIRYRQRIFAFCSK